MTNNLMSPEELSIIATKLSLPHRTEDDWAEIKAFLADRDVIVMEAPTYPSKGHLTIFDGALLSFTTVEKCTAWIDRYAPRIRFMIGSLPFKQAMDVSDVQHKPLYLDINYDGTFLCYEKGHLKARTLMKPAVIENFMNVGPNDPCPCGSGKKYKKCCGRG